MRPAIPARWPQTLGNFSGAHRQKTGKQLLAQLRFIALAGLVLFKTVTLVFQCFKDFVATEHTRV
jgi:hypothetical protein